MQTYKRRRINGFTSEFDNEEIIRDMDQKVSTGVIPTFNGVVCSDVQGDNGFTFNGPAIQGKNGLVNILPNGRPAIFSQDEEQMYWTDANAIVSKGIRPKTNGLVRCGVNGGAWSDVRSLTFTSPSDLNMKQDIMEVDLKESTDLVKAINPKCYRYILEVEQDAKARPHHGFIAQDFHAYFLSLPTPPACVQPELDENGNMTYSIRYQELVPILWKVNQGILTRLDAIEAYQTALEARITALENP